MSANDRAIILRELSGGRPGADDDKRFHAQWLIDCERIGDALAEIDPLEFNRVEFRKALGIKP